MAHWVIENTVTGDGPVVRLRVKETPDNNSPQTGKLVIGPYSSSETAGAVRELMAAHYADIGWEVTV